MKRHSLFCGGFWPLLCWILIPLVLLLLTLASKWRSIEENVASNAEQHLSSQGFDWAKTDTFNHGRTVVIKGIAPSQDDADKALEVAKQAKGVHLVKFDQNQISIAPKTPPYLNSIVTQNSIVLRGTVKDQETINQLLSKAGSVFGKENVLNKLSIGDNTDDFTYHTGFFEAMRGKGNTVPFSASIVDGQLSLNGQTVDTQSRTNIAKTMGQITGLSINNNINVVLPPVIEAIEEPEPIDCLSLVQEALSNDKINFDSGKAIISQSSFTLLQSIADSIKHCPDSRLIIAGHTDSTGNLGFNNRLSEQRAQAVVTHLGGLDIDTSRLSAIGYGPSQPIADNNTADGRAQNRRIEFKLQTEQNSTNLGETE